ncbi:hypothetical protein WAK64_08340 [Bacillus spongiae]|uniref:Uncharacterized protein n=1 Tax=Bacillus spongiae TaxID=2683610 RepID=A0ABU8HCZ1_9BACI
MQVQPQISSSVTIVTKKEMTLRRVLNTYGFFTVISLVLWIFTNPITLENMNFYFNDKKMLETYQIMKYMSFVAGSGVIYFFLVNIYFMGQKWRKVFYTAITLLFCLSLFMVFYLLPNATPH